MWAWWSRCQIDRRRFLQATIRAGGLWVLRPLASAQTASAVPAVLPRPSSSSGILLTADSPLAPIDLSPAHWMGRCLPSTVVLFRRELILHTRPAKATGRIVADSRYKLTVNGKRIQWGPAPCDPRWPEADPLDLTDQLQIGKNVIGASVLFYGAGDGTWVAGKPGFLFLLDIEWPDGRKEQVISDDHWHAHLARSWPPGHYKRWYLRAFQEEFDARLYPDGWDHPDFELDDRWRAAAIYSSGGDKPSVCSKSATVMESQGDPKICSLRKRSVPMLNETVLGGFQLKESSWLTWHCPPEEYFECVPPNAFTGEWASAAQEISPGVWQVKPNGSKTPALTFARDEQVVGWPAFMIDAPAGTVVEILVHEGHKLGGPFLLNTHFHSWTRFICREGENRFETFDFESFRWFQFVIRNYDRPVTLKEISVRRRIFPWLAQPSVNCSDPILQKLFEASLNTLDNSAQDTVVDGMARERQQYSGDGGHQLHAIYYARGEIRLPGRFVNTYGQGATPYGYFLDCWPAFDRIQRIGERHLQLTPWGPILDHSLGFTFDCFYYHLYSGKLDMLQETYPRFAKLVEYFRTIRDENGLLKVEDLGIPVVWLDQFAYKQQRHKQCAFNLYAAAAFQHSLAPLARAFGDEGWARSIESFGRELEAAAVKRFWDSNRRVFVCNLPWSLEESAIRTCDRSLATSILFDQCPGSAIETALNMLTNCPPEMGLSYTANAVWRYWALAKSRSMNAVLDDFRNRWAKMASVQENSTLSENWVAVYDSGSEWSHCPISPLILLYHGILGLRPAEPGFAKCVLAPQLGDLEHISCQAHTPRGTVRFSAKKLGNGHEFTLFFPAEIEVELVLDAHLSVPLSPGHVPAPSGCKSYLLPSGREVVLQVA